MTKFNVAKSGLGNTPYGRPSRKQPRKELPYLCLLNEYIQLPYLCLLNEEDFWLSGTGHPGTGPEPAVCMGARDGYVLLIRLGPFILL